MKVPVSPEVVKWILSWGPEVEVLEPEGLRQRVAEKLADALQPYVSLGQAIECDIT